MIKILLNLLFPSICAACGNSLLKSEKTICISCISLLPETFYAHYKDNPIEKLFWGKAKVNSASSFLFFNKGGKVQNLIHNLKYSGHKEVGRRLGHMMAGRFIKVKGFTIPDTIIPVPLHPKKQAFRGYNQCDPICEGLQEIFKCEISKNNLVRVIANPSQTKKSSYARWENVDGIFEVKYPAELQNKNVMLVDDVITTGSTMQSCINALNKVPGMRINVATIASA